MKHNSPLNNKVNNHSHTTPNTHRVNDAMEAILTRNLYYKEQVTNTPAEYYYHVGDVSFDGYRDGVLVDARGEGLLKYIETNWTASVYGNGGLVDWALRKLEAVHNAGATTPIQWHIAEKDTFDDLFNRQKSGEFPAEIELIHTPPN